MTLLDKAADMGMGADALPLQKALFSAEPYTPAQQARIEGEYGMRATSAYGTADLGFIGYTRADMPGFRILSGIYLQVCDPDTGAPLPDGEIGEIVATTLNRAYPLIRFGTGDLGALAPPVDGEAQHLLGLYGRSGDAIKVRGMFLHPNQLAAAVMQFPQIADLQAVITREGNSDVVTLRVALREDASDEGVAAGLTALAQQAARLRIDQVEFVDEIDASARKIQDMRDWD